MLERLFVDFLGQLQPKSEYLRLFGEIIIDVWKQKQVEVVKQREAARRHLDTLRERKQYLVEAFVYERVIDRTTYQEQLDKLNEEIALAEINERETQIEEMDLQAAVGFGEFVLLNASRLWVQLSPDQKQRLQQTNIPPRGAV